MAAILDAILLPGEFFRELPVSKKTYVFCFAVAGAFRVLPALLFDHAQALFLSRPPLIALLNAAIALFYVFAVGALDCLLFCKPLADFFTLLSGKLGGRRDGQLSLKTMKIYAIATLITQTFSVIVTRALFRIFAQSSSSAQPGGGAYTLCLVLFYAWLFAIVGHGLGCILRYKGWHRYCVLPVSLAWGAAWTLLANALVSRFIPFYFF